MTGELPLRIVEQPGGPVIRCLCGAEASVLRRSMANGLWVVVLDGPARIRLGPDVSPAAVLSMIVHAQVCTRVRA